MCASISNKNCNYKPAKSFITQNHLLILWKKHREKIHNAGKTQGILSRLECGHPVSTGHFYLQMSSISEGCFIFLKCRKDHCTSEFIGIVNVVYSSFYSCRKFERVNWATMSVSKFVFLNLVYQKHFTIFFSTRNWPLVYAITWS